MSSQSRTSSSPAFADSGSAPLTSANSRPQVALVSSLAGPDRTHSGGKAITFGNVTDGGDESTKTSSVQAPVQTNSSSQTLQAHSTNASQTNHKRRTLRKKRTMQSVAHHTMGNTVQVLQNPFDNNPELGCYELIKRIIVGFTLFPIRILVFIPLVLFLWALARLIVIGFPLEADRGCYMHKKPLSGIRYCLATPIPYLFRIFLWCMGFWSISVVDHREDTSVNPNIIVIGPHVTMFDMFVMMYVYPRSGFLGQHAVVKIPILNSLGTVTQGMFIDLGDKESKFSCKEGIAARASPDWKGGKLHIFPEGTITNGKQLVQFKAGAFTPGLPVQPVILRYPFEHFDISWVGQNRDPWWVFRCCLQVTNYCEVDILDVYHPNEEEKKNAIMFANNVREVLADWDNLPTTEHTYDDVFFYHQAMQIGVGNDFLVKDLKKMFEVDSDTLKKWLVMFNEADKEDKGYLTYQDVIDMMNLGGDESNFKHIFSFFDTDNSGQIEYREFVQILALMSGKSSPKDVAMLAFIILDHKKKGVVNKGQLIHGVNKMFRNHQTQRRVYLGGGGGSGTAGSKSTIIRSVNSSSNFGSGMTASASLGEASACTASGAQSSGRSSDTGPSDTRGSDKFPRAFSNTASQLQSEKSDLDRDRLSSGTSTNRFSSATPLTDRGSHQEELSLGHVVLADIEGDEVTMAAFSKAVDDKREVLKAALEEMRNSKNRNSRATRINLHKVKDIRGLAKAEPDSHKDMPEKTNSKVKLPDVEEAPEKEEKARESLGFTTI